MPSKSDINNRFIVAIEQIKKVDKRYASNTNIAKKLGCSPQLLNEVLKGRMNANTDILQKLFIEFSVSSEFIFKGTLPVMYLYIEPIAPMPTTKPPTIKEIRLPLIPIEAAAGYANGDNPVLELDCEYYTIPEFNKSADYLIRISGNSMAPKYYNGDIVACKKIPIDTFFQWGKVYILDTIQGALCKRVDRSDVSDNITLISDNPKYKPFDLHRNEVRSLALVVGVIRLE